MTTMKQEEFNKRYVQHLKWLDGKKGGVQFRTTHRDLSGLEFPKRLDQVIILACHMFQSSFRDVSLQGAALHYCTFFKSDFEGADLTAADLKDCDFVGCNLRGANFEGADLHHADLYDADAMYANFRGANLHGANLWFKRAKIEVWQAVQRAMTLHVFQTNTAGKGDAAV